MPGTLVRHSDVDDRRWQNAMPPVQRLAEHCSIPLYLGDIHPTRARMLHEAEELSQVAPLFRHLGCDCRYGEREDAETSMA
ncbi:MAG: hypothetical protein ACK58L_14685 [Planctomycetota bacterium]